MTPCRRARQKEGSRSSTSGVDSTSTSSGAASSGAHGTSSSSICCSRSPRTVAVVRAAAVQLDVEQRAEERPERVVRRRRLVLLAAQLDLPHVGAVLPQLLGETRLADSGLADELDERSEAHPHRRDGRAEHCPLALAVDERAARPQRRRLRSLGRGEELAEDERLDGLGLPFERERLELRRLERRRRRARARPPRPRSRPRRRAPSAARRARRCRRGRCTSGGSSPRPGP